MKINNLILKSFLSIGFLFCIGSINAQTTEIAVIDSTSQTASNWKFGVGFGLNFVGGTNISIAPNLTYKVSDKISFGGGIQGSYSAIKDLQSTTTFGGNLVTFYSPSKKITTLLEFAQLRVTTKTNNPLGDLKNSYWDSALFLGAGYNITNKILIGAKYNLLYKEDESVYTSAIIPFVNISF